MYMGSHPLYERAGLNTYAYTTWGYDLILSSRK